MKPLEEISNHAGGAPDGPAGAGDEEPTGMPWLRTWRAMYWFVLASFVFYVVLLAVFSRVFS